MYNYDINKKLSDTKSGNYLIKVTKIGDKRRSKFCSYEYYCDVNYQVTDLSNPTRKKGVVVAGMGASPIELNVDKSLHSIPYWDWESFDDKLFETLFRLQKCINQEGYYLKDRDTGKVVANA